MKKKVTLHQIAQKAGVSISTVSLVLNNRPNRISDEKKQEILEIAKQEGYIIKPKKQKDTSLPITIALLIPDISNPFFSDMIQGVIDYVHLIKGRLLLGTNGESPQKDSEQLKEFINANISALLITPSYNCPPSLLENIPFPVIQVDRQSPTVPHSTVRLNNKKGGYLATQHLINNRHKKIACLTGPSWLLSSQERLDGYRWAMDEAKIPVSKNMIFEGNYQTDSGYRLAPDILNRDFTALFCCNDTMALGIYQYMLQQNLRVGEDLSIIGFDDITTCRFLKPPLTTIRQSGYEIGYEACKRAFAEINDPSLIKSTILFEPELIIRESVIHLP